VRTSASASAARARRADCHNRRGERDCRGAGHAQRRSASAGSADATTSFDYGTTTAYGSLAIASPASLPAGHPSLAIAATVQGLACGTTYHFRARAQSTVATAVGADQTLATAACAPPPPTPVAPAASTSAASAIAATQAT
jgi:hypothetical protein